MALDPRMVAAMLMRRRMMGGGAGAPGMQPPPGMHPGGPMFGGPGGPDVAGEGGPGEMGVPDEGNAELGPDFQPGVPGMPGALGGPLGAVQPHRTFGKGHPKPPMNPRAPAGPHMPNFKAAASKRIGARRGFQRGR